ncbi:hypothetical protein G6F21_014586 [Rhizopus arrhizus]|nr:hypothetical protein G6F21_014586 [Rhizopus arrhizus]
MRLLRGTGAALRRGSPSRHRPASTAPRRVARPPGRGCAAVASAVPGCWSAAPGHRRPPPSAGGPPHGARHRPAAMRHCRRPHAHPPAARPGSAHRAGPG